MSATNGVPKSGTFLFTVSAPNLNLRIFSC